MVHHGNLHIINWRRPDVFVGPTFEKRHENTHRAIWNAVWCVFERADAVLHGVRADAFSYDPVLIRKRFRKSVVD